MNLRALALAAALVACSATAGAAAKPLESTELIRRGAGLAMLRSYLALGRFYLKHNKAERARQILTYGLLHDPSNADLLSETARAEVRLGRLQEALAYAAEADRLEPTPERAWALSEVERLLAAQAASSATTATSATTASTPAAKPVSAPAPPEPKPAPLGELAAKARALRIAVSLESAIKGYNVGKPKKERMTKLDIDKLKAEHLLPEEFELSSLHVSLVTSEGKVTVEGQGTAEEMATVTGPYEKASAEASKHLASGALAEATYLLQEMRRAYPKEPEVKERLLYALREQRRWTDALAIVEEELKAAPGDARLRYERALLMLQDGRVEESVEHLTRLRADRGAGVYAVLGRELAELAAKGASRELEQDILRASEAAGAPSEPASAPATGGGHR